MSLLRPATLALVPLAFLFGGFVGSASATSITIVNGSFELESGLNTAQSFSTVFAIDSASIPGWTVSAGSVDYIRTYWDAADGSRSLDMGGNSAGTISQVISVPYAGNVSINFAMAGNTDGAPTVKNLRVMLISPNLFQDFVFDVTGQSIPHNMGWVNNTAVFTGIAAGSYTLSFQSLDAGAYGPALDNISASVPDGGMTASLLGMALAGLAYLRRKQA